MLTAFRAATICAVLAAGVSSLDRPVAAAEVKPAQLEALDRLEFDVLRDGDKIGEHKFVFRHEGASLNVVIDTDVRVKLAFVTLYRFLHHGTETWVDNRLVALSSTTDDDGTNHAMIVAMRDDKLVVTADKKSTFRSAETIPASLWHPGILKAHATLNTVDGTMMAIKVMLVGDETVQSSSGPILAQHFTIDGDLRRELWFDLTGRLVKVRFKGQDGSDIQYILR